MSLRLGLKGLWGYACIRERKNVSTSCIEYRCCSISWTKSERENRKVLEGAMKLFFFSVLAKRVRAVLCKVVLVFCFVSLLLMESETSWRVLMKIRNEIFLSVFNESSETVLFTIQVEMKRRPVKGAWISSFSHAFVIADQVQERYKDCASFTIRFSNSICNAFLFSFLLLIAKVPVKGFSSVTKWEIFEVEAKEEHRDVWKLHFPDICSFI